VALTRIIFCQRKRRRTQRDGVARSLKADASKSGGAADPIGPYTTQNVSLSVVLREFVFVGFATGDAPAF